MRPVATILGLASASLVCLWGGALTAVSCEGLPRLLLAGAGFAGYLFFFARALNGLALPVVVIERPAPDGEVRRGDFLRRTRADGRTKRAAVAAAVAALFAFNATTAFAE